jgi:hypothetical protein
MSNTADPKALTDALSAPFDPAEVRFKPAAVNGNRALALAYVDARVIQDRLDEVLGVNGWSDDYQVLPDGSVVCRLRVHFGDTWVTKTDAGGASDQPDGGDRLKAAFSDALKRAAVKFGIGRYLYRLPAQWVDWDPGKKRFARPPAVLTPANGAGTITAKEVRQLGDLLARKGKAPGTALKAVGNPGARLEDLTHTQYADLMRRLSKLPDKSIDQPAPDR